MFGIAGISLVAWFLSLRTWLLAGSLLKRLQKIPGFDARATRDALAIKAQSVRLLPIARRPSPGTPRGGKSHAAPS